MHKHFKSIVCLTVAFAIFLSAYASADTLNSVSVAAASLSSDKPTLDGMVRVYLSSLGSPNRVTLTVSGSYSLSNGTSLTSGENLTVSFNSATGVITLTRGGTAYSMGSAFTLRRHSTTGSNGIKISQARKPGNLYPGDIQFKAVAQSSGSYKLYTIAHIYIEDYLYGVVPYEMGSSAPLEALKAQAVAARTYTVRMMNVRSSWSYDVVDTTGDQTYNGTPTTETNCNTAVDATKGIVLKNGSAYTATYYSASNGGQTESIYNAWRTGGYSYLGVKDDPFDYANPYSVVKKTTVYADANSSGNSASLISLLKTKAVSFLSRAGYSANTSNTMINTIKDITPHTSMYASPSKLYTKMDFTLSVGTYNASNVYVAVTTTVTCDIFDELESLLGMSIQSLDNELWSVGQTTSGFEIQARRYGHGIGMSQRGAMYMGQLGYTYDEILGFYYEGSSRVGCTFTNTILAADSSEEITSAEDPAETDDGTIRGTVSMSGSDNLVVRNAKSASASVLTVLSNGTSVTVLSNDGTWCLITFGSITGYVPTSSLSLSGTAAETDATTVSSIDGFAVVTANGYLNLRQTGSYSAAILATAPSAAILTVLSWDSAWAYVQYGTIVAYACSEYLTFSESYPQKIEETDTTGTQPDTGDTPADETLTAIVATDSGSLNMRQFAQAGSTILTTIPKSATVTVASQGATWSGITYLGLDGYVMTMFLSFTEDTDGTAAADEEQTAALRAMVVTQSGSLNLRQQPKSGSAIYCTIPRLEVITVISQGSEWCQVTYAGITGYVMTVFLSMIDSDTEDTGATDEEDDTTGDTETVTAVVTTESGSLNLRAEALSGSKVLTRIPQGETVPVLQRLSTWTYTCYQDYYGYVMNAYLVFSNAKSEAGTTNGSFVSAKVITASGSLNLRDGPYGNILAQIPQNATVSVYTKGSDWCYVCYNGTYGYAMTTYLSIQASSSTESTTDSSASSSSGDSSAAASVQATVATVAADSGQLSLWATRSLSADVLTTIPNGTLVTLLVQGDEWCKISYNAYQGYVQTAYLIITASQTDQSAESTSAEEKAEPSAAPSTEASTADTLYSVTAWINTASGSLNLRETASSNAAILLQIPQYTEVEVTTDITETWCQIIYNDIAGYVISAYLTTTNPNTVSSTAESTADTGGASTGDTGDSDDSDTEDAAIAEEEPSLPMDSTLHEPDILILVFIRPPAGYAGLGLYTACSESSERLDIMPEGAEVEIVQVGTTWCEVLFEEQQGYCLRDGLSYFEE